MFYRQNIDLELSFSFSSPFKGKLSGSKIDISFAVLKSSGSKIKRSASMLYEAEVIVKLNGNTATALLNVRGNPTYNESNYGNHFWCSVKLLNFENQITRSTGYGSV